MAAFVLLASAPASDGAWTGTGTIGDPYKINDATDLALLASDVNSGANDYAGEYFLLTADIDLGASSWVPIGYDGFPSRPFAGIFNGDNHVIKNISINQAGMDYVGLFGYIETGTVQNLGIVGGTITGKNYVGSVVGCNDGTVENCYNTAAVSGTGDVGGVVGQNYGTVMNCYNRGVVISINNYVGGVAGFNGMVGLIENCYNTGAVTGNRYAGGVFGQNSAGTIRSCYNTGFVTATYAGVGSNYDGGVGGFASGTISNCFFNVDNYIGQGIGGGAGSATGLTAAEMTAADVLTGNMSGLGAAFGKSAADLIADSCYYPELNVFKNSADADIKAVSKASAAVALRTPSFAGTLSPITYGDALSSSAPSGSFTDPVTGASISGTFSWVGGSTTHPAVSDSGVTAYYYNVGTLEIYKSAAATVTVNRATLTVTPYSGQGKVSGQAEPALNYTVLGWKLSDSSAALMTGSLDRAVGETVGTYAYALGSLSAGPNYDLVLAGGLTFRISSPGDGDYYITAISDLRSTISPDGIVAAQRGDNVTFLFSADTGYHILSIIVDGVHLTQAQIDLGRYTFTDLMANHRIEVESSVGSRSGYALGITVAEGRGHARYSVDGSAFTTYGTGAIIPAGADLVITAVADRGYGFEKWETPAVINASQLSFRNVDSPLELKLFFAEGLYSGDDSDDNNTWLWIAVAIAVILVIALLAWFVFSGRKKEDGKS